MDLKIGEKVYLKLRKEFGIVHKIEDEWTDYPHGSGIDYQKITIILPNEIIEVDTLFDIERIITKASVESTISYLKDKIIKTVEEIGNEIKDQENLLSLF